MNSGELQRLLLRIFLGFLGLTAFIAIWFVLAGDFGKLQAKVLGTTSAIAGASICSMSCAAFIGKRRHRALGFAGIVLSVAAAVLAIAGMWPEIQNDLFWKSTATVAVLALGLAIAFLLNLPELDHEHRWIQLVSSIAIAVLALQIIGALWGEISNDHYYRGLTAVAIVVGLATLVVPIMMKLRKGEGRKRERIVLERMEGAIFADASGRRFEVKEIAADQDRKSAAADGEARS